MASLPGRRLEIIINLHRDCDTLSAYAFWSGPRLAGQEEISYLPWIEGVFRIPLKEEVFMEESSEFLVSLEGVNHAEAATLIDDLQTELRRNGIEARRTREDETTLDFGATLVLVLGAPAVVIAARALRDWANRKNAGTIIRKRNGETVVKGLESKDVAAVAQALDLARKAK